MNLWFPSIIHSWRVYRLADTQKTIQIWMQSSAWAQHVCWWIQSDKIFEWSSAIVHTTHGSTIDESKCYWCCGLIHVSWLNYWLSRIGLLIAEWIPARVVMGSLFESLGWHLTESSCLEAMNQLIWLRSDSVPATCWMRFPEIQRERNQLESHETIDNKRERKTKSVRENL